MHEILTRISDSPAAQGHDVVGRYYGDDPRSEDHFLAIRSWLNSCLSHKKCQESASGRSQINAQDAALPTRCIELTNKNILLCETKGQRGSYLTLSHRWGPLTEISKTTTSNYHQRKDGRGFDDLPKSFQDAFLIAQQLGVRYIWIDSLCIIQAGDDGLDWKKEATKMAQYYQQSLLTIAATDTSEQGGLLTPRPDRAIRSLVRLIYRDRKNAPRGHFYIYKPSRRSHAMYLSRVREGELLSRGWVFQEWFLSRRIIYYTPCEIFFECQTDLPRSERQHTIDTEYAGDLLAKQRFQFRPSSGYDSWYDIIHSYSGTTLTIPSKDRVIAISGVAKEFQQMIWSNNEAQSKNFPYYIAGLWLPDIHHGLLWQTDALNAALCSCGAPSWSWASRLANVRWLKRSARAEVGFEVTALISSSARSYTMHELERLTASSNVFPTKSNAPVAIQSFKNIFGVTNIVASIMLRGRIQAALINNASTDIDLLQTLARETDVTLPEDHRLWTKHIDGRRALSWKPVTSPSTPHVVGGWALFDGPDMQSQLDKYEGISLLALHVSTRKQVAPGGSGILYKLNLRHDVYDVLFLEPMGGCRYRRLGVGRLFERNIMRAFQETEMQDIELV